MKEQQFKDLMYKACEGCMHEDIENFLSIDSTEAPEFSPKLKRKMNMSFRLHTTDEYIPHPEVDTRYERLKAKTINKFIATKNKLKRI